MTTYSNFILFIQLYNIIQNNHAVEMDVSSPLKRSREDADADADETVAGNDDEYAPEYNKENEDENMMGTPSKKPRQSRQSMQSPLKAINAPGKPAEAGIITKIYCENFMCHRKLTVTLNRNVNFIHGQNGSGKSAILAAVQICLGAGKVFIRTKLCIFHRFIEN